MKNKYIYIVVMDEDQRDSFKKVPPLGAHEMNFIVPKEDFLFASDPLIPWKTIFNAAAYAFYRAFKLTEPLNDAREFKG